MHALFESEEYQALSPEEKAVATLTAIVTTCVEHKFDEAKSILADVQGCNGLPTKGTMDYINSSIEYNYVVHYKLVSKAVDEGHCMVETDLIPYVCIVNDVATVKCGNHPNAVNITKRGQIAYSLAMADEDGDYQAMPRIVNLHCPSDSSPEEICAHLNNKCNGEATFEVKNNEVVLATH